MVFADPGCLFSASGIKDCEQSAPQFFIIGNKASNYAYQGLTESGLAAFKKLRNAMRQRFNLFSNEFKSLENVHHAATVARLFKGNMLLYGPPGGAKSAVVKWIFKGEAEQAFQLQVHQMITESAFIGGQNFEKAKLGEFEINTNSSIANFIVANIDEIEKGNPSALSALLSLLNEREILVGTRVIKAKTETVFATSNANLPEFFTQFIENGQRSTAPALLNRFQFKAFVYNWLSVEDQAALDERVAELRRLKVIANILGGSAVLNQEEFVEPEIIDWNTARQFAELMVQFDKYFLINYRELMEVMRTSTHEAIRASEAELKADRSLIPYFPSCDYTERVRQQIPQIIRFSFFIDLLLSDLSNDENLVHFSRGKTFHIGPLSLWRAYLVTTTIGSGKTKLSFGPSKSSEASVEFGRIFSEVSARDLRETLIAKHMKEEEDRFRTAFASRMRKFQEELKSAVQFSLSKSDEAFSNDLELQIANQSIQ